MSKHKVLAVVVGIVVMISGAPCSWDRVHGDDITHGNLSDNTRIHSVNLGYDLIYRVYTPAGYDGTNARPVFYVTDGNEYADPEFGAMPITLDNLIADGLIEPVIVVFIDARNPDDLNQNRRGYEYLANARYAAFLVTELVPAIDAAYRTTSERGILGASIGGLNAAFVGFTYPDLFGWVAMQSPVFRGTESVVDDYEGSDRLPIKVFMSVGDLREDRKNVLRLLSILADKDYPLMYVEVQAEHSYDAWRVQLDDLLIYFLGTDRALQPD
jgi:enterochelin esterase-like enzyme